MSDTQLAGAPGTSQPATNPPSARVAEAERIARAASMLPTAAPAAPTILTEPPVVPPETKTADAPKPPSPFKDAIAEMRAKREKEAAEAQRRSSFEQENAKLKQELEAVKKASAFEDDPIAFAKARGWSREEQLNYGKALIYDLAPDQADPNFRVKMFEQKQAREAKEKTAREQQERQEADRKAAEQEFRTWTEGLEAAVMNFDAGSYPESEAWYGNDVEGYFSAVVQTAMRMAQKATKEGRAADLTPGAIASELEADIARRAAERDKRRSQRQPSTGTQQSTTAPTVGAEAEQSLDGFSSKDMSGSGTPLPPARSESERVQRAIAAAFPKR